MMALDAMDLEACCILHGKLHQPHRGKESEDHGRCRRGREPFIPRDLLVMVAEIQADLPLDHGIHEQPHHREHGQGRDPFGFLQPHRTDGGGIFDPTKARFHRDMLFLIRLEHLGICTHRWLQRGRQDGPPVCVLGRDQGLWGHDQARAAGPLGGLDRGGLGRRRPASTRPFLRDTDRYDPIVQDMVTPRPWRAPTPPLATPFVLGYGCLCVGSTGKPPRFHMLDVLCDTLSFLGLRGGICHRGLVGQLARVDDQKA